MTNRRMTTEQVAYHAITELKDTRRELEQMAVKAATVQRENRRLKRMVQDNVKGHILHRARADAEHLLNLRFSGFSISRRSAENHMSRRRWIWAIALLRKARVIEDNAPAVDDAFLVEDFETAVRMVAAAVEVVEKGGIQLLLMRCPKGFAKWPKRAQ
jgi:hypothetical protein